MQLTGPILVTGGAGYIGGQTVLSLLELGIEVIVLDDLSTGRMRPFHEQTIFYEGNAGDEKLVKEVLYRHKITSILHFAGSIRVDESIENPLKYYGNNTEVSRALISAAVDTAVEHFIFSSTAAVYGSVRQPGLVKENYEVSPLNPYGWSKLFTERTLRDAAGAHNITYGILRYFNVAGADPELRHGQFAENPVHLIGRAINAMRGKAPPLQIFGGDLPTSDGTGVRDYIHVADLAQAHVAALYALQQEQKNLLTNLGYGKGYSVLEVIKAIEAVSGQKVPYEIGPAREGEAASVVADTANLNDLLQWQPLHNDLENIVASAINWMDVCEKNRT
jgi:UDP-glucose 4-epimerase